jgi:hypothetical protein
MNKQKSSRSFKPTLITSQGLDFAALFTAKFSRYDLGGFKAMMREPAGVSTAGGKQATQHIVLARGDGVGATITVGHANVATKHCKLRTHACVERMHQLRYRGEIFPLDHARYQAFFDGVREFLERQGMRIEVETQPPGGMASVPPPGGGSVGGSKSSMLLSILVGLLAFAAAAVGALYFMGKL